MIMNVEQTLFKAWTRGEGAHLSAHEVEMLIADDAVATRISNMAASMAGAGYPGCNCIYRSFRGMTWDEFMDRLRRDYPRS